MNATEVLKHEHRVIGMALEAARRELHELRESGTLDFPQVEKIMDFGKNFLDRCHHAKEENYLFLKLAEKGQPEDKGLLAELLAEHRRGREHLAAMFQALGQAQAGEQGALKELAGLLKAYLELLTDHILKEDEFLWPLADRLLTPAEQEALTQAFEAFEAQEMGPGAHERYHALALELKGQ